MMDAAAVQMLVAEAVAQAIAATRGNGGGHGGGSSQIHKHYTRLDKLVPEEWKEWHYQFSVATHAFHAKNGALLELVEQKELDEVSTESLELVLQPDEVEWMRKSQSEMFSALSLLTKGEANQLVRSCEDKNGYTAWKRLYDRYNPKTSGEPDGGVARSHQTQQDQGHARSGQSHRLVGEQGRDAEEGARRGAHHRAESIAALGDVA